MLVEQLDYNLLFRWFNWSQLWRSRLAWHPTTFLVLLMDSPEVKPLLSSELFGEGTLLLRA